MVLYRIFSKNNYLAFALLPLLLAGLRVRLFTAGALPPVGDVDTPLWSLLVESIKGNMLYINIAAVLLTLVSALAVNRLANHYHFIQKQTNLTAFFYILFTSGFIMVQELHPILLFTPFFIIAMERLFLAVAATQPMRYTFEAAFWTSVASLFYGKGIWFFPLLLLAMAMMRVFSFKSFMAAMIGLLLPYLFAATWFFVNNELKLFGDSLVESILTPVAFFNHNILSQIYLFSTVIFVVFGLLSAIRRLTTVKIITRKYYRFVIWVVFYPSALVFTPYFSFDVLPLVAIGASVLSATMVTFWQKSRFREMVILSLVILTLLTQWFVG